MDKVGWEHTICFKMLDIGYYYIRLTVHSIRNFICGWLGDVYDCYVLFSQSFNEPSKPFQGVSRLDVIYGSNEVFGSVRNGQLAPGFHDDIDHSDFNDVVMISLNDSDGFD